MANNQNLLPFRWVPSAQNQLGASSPVPGTLIPGGEVRAGDWCQVFISYTNGTPAVAYATNRFLIHVVYTPNSDDATAHEDQAVTYGGSASNRRRNYHIDTGVAFQVPFDGQLSVIAGDDSDSRTVVDVLLVRGFRPRDKYREREQQQAEVIRQVEDMTDIVMFGMPLREPNGHDTRSLGPTGLYPPPIVGVPQLVPSTWIDIPAATLIPFPDGAVKMVAVFAPLAVVAPVTFNFATLGNALSADLVSGLPIDVATFAQGFACTTGTRPTWSPTVNLKSVTIYSSLGG